jgi:hypothetical protein
LTRLLEEDHSSLFKSINEFIDFRVRSVIPKGLRGIDEPVASGEVGLANGIFCWQTKQDALVGCVNLRRPRAKFGWIYFIVCHRPQTTGPRRKQLCRVIEQAGKILVAPFTSLMVMIGVLAGAGPASGNTRSDDAGDCDADD